MAWHSFELEVDRGERTVLVSRHGRTTANEDGIHQNWGSYTLSASGQADVDAAKEWWQQWTLTRCISSPIPRAMETAQQLWGRVDELDSAWGERAVPAAEGLTLEEAHRRYPDVVQDDGWVSPDAPMNPFVESAAAVHSRVSHALRRAAATVPNGHVVAVMTHGAVLASLLRGDESDDPREHARRFGNLSVLELAVDPAQGWSIRKQHDPLHRARQPREGVS